MVEICVHGIFHGTCIPLESDRRAWLAEMVRLPKMFENQVRFS